MPITRKEVEHIAGLARIALTEEEKTTFERDLSSILDFIAALNEADTGEIIPMAGGTALKSVMRRDERLETDLEGKSSELLMAAPQKRDNWIKVKEVFS